MGQQQLHISIASPRQTKIPQVVSCTPTTLDRCSTTADRQVSLGGVKWITRRRQMLHVSSRTEERGADLGRHVSRRPGGIGPVVMFIQATFSRRREGSDWKSGSGSEVLVVIRRVAQMLWAGVERAWFKSNSSSWLTRKRDAARGCAPSDSHKSPHKCVWTQNTSAPSHQPFWKRAQIAGCDRRFYGQNKSKNLCCVSFYDRAD